MNLTYSVLWIDDQAEAIMGAKDELEIYIESQGYIPNIILLSNPEDIADKLGKKWDLLMVDYHLDQTNGSEIIRRIREKSIFTEVIFYSGDSEALNSKIRAEALEGIYWTIKDDDLSEFINKAQKVINLTLNKVMDVNTMRGIVMAEVAEMDYQISDIILFQHNNIDAEKRKKLIKKIACKVISSAKSNVRKGDEIIDSGTIDECLDYRFTSSSHKLNAVRGIVKRLGLENKDEIIRELEQCEDLLRKRNILAHGKTMNDDENGEFIQSGGNRFGLEEALDLRIKIRDQRLKFMAIFENFKHHYTEA